MDISKLMDNLLGLNINNLDWFILWAWNKVFPISTENNRMNFTCKFWLVFLERKWGLLVWRSWKWWTCCLVSISKILIDRSLEAEAINLLSGLTATILTLSYGKVFFPLKWKFFGFHWSLLKRLPTFFCKMGNKTKLTTIIYFKALFNLNILINM